VAVQSDGRIVVAGSAYNGNDDDFAVARYNPDGTPDTTFNGTGRVTTGIGGGADAGTCVALQSDGRIVVAGFSYNGTNKDFAVVRYNSDGTLDTTFNGTGKVVTPLGGDSSGKSVAVQSDGKIVVAGSAFNGTDYDFALVRYHGNASTGTPGTLDTTFNGTGTVVQPIGTGDDFITGMALQSNGKIVVAGYSNNAGSIDCALARYNADGTPDTDFNGTGNVATSLSSTGDDEFLAVAVQSDGKIVAAGYAYNGTNYDFALVRYHGDSSTGTPGTLDTDFNGTGKVITPLGAGDDTLSGLALQSDGKIVVAGHSYNGSSFVCAVARYTAGGILDTTFKGTGTTTVDLGNGDDLVGGVALQGDGKIVVAGTVNSNVTDFALARILGDGPAIAVQTGVGTSVFDGISTVNLGSALPSVSTSTTFTIQNTGTADLTGLGITFDGADYANFSVIADSAAPVSPTGSTTFTLRFLPTSAGPKSAALHIACNVTGNTQSFDLNLTGTGLTPAENWRQQHFGTTLNSGNAGDLADPNGNGVNNLLEYALGGDPLGSASGISILPQVARSPGNTARIDLTRYLDRTDVTLTVQAADSLLGPWTALASSTAGAPFEVLAPGATVSESGSGNQRSVSVTDLCTINDPAHPKRFMRLEVKR
jgi:uncharacterized delta-60 repeat protein